MWTLTPSCAGSCVCSVDTNAADKYRDAADASQLQQQDKDNDKDEEEEVIRCVCNVYRDEGKMIQCERCHVCHRPLLVTQ